MIFAAVHFDRIDQINGKFYSQMKFGNVDIAKLFGTTMANNFFEQHKDVVISNNIVVITSPYNFVANAATLIGKYFIRQLNHLSVQAVGRPIEQTVIHRKVSYTNDYGFLSQQQRENLINQDDFYINHKFVDQKLIIFLDDVRITGTHERKVEQVLDENNLKNQFIHCYYGQYHGTDPTIEGKLNFTAFSSFDQYLNEIERGNYEFIVRPLKYILSQPNDVIVESLNNHRFTKSQIDEIYHNCLAEKYYQIPQYQQNFNTFKSQLSLI